MIFLRTKSVFCAIWAAFNDFLCVGIANSRQFLELVLGSQNSRSTRPDIGASEAADFPCDGKELAFPGRPYHRRNSQHAQRTNQGLVWMGFSSYKTSLLFKLRVTPMWRDF